MNRGNGETEMKPIRKSSLTVLAIILICILNVAAKKGKPAIDGAALKTTLAAITSDFQKLEKNLQQRKINFSKGLRKPGFDPQEAVRLDRQFLNGIQNAAKLNEKWIKASQKGGRPNAKAHNWETKITRLHAQWINQAMAAGENPKAGKSAHLASLKLMLTVIARSEDESDLASFRPRLARLYQLSEKHADAVRAFMELADPQRTTDARRRIQYLTSAAASQSVLAHWPVTPPWREVADGKLKEAAHSADPGARKELKDIFTRLAQEQGGIDNTLNWTFDAHIGLIDWTAGQIQEAMDLWKPRLNSQAALNEKMANHRAQAAGFTLVELRAKKSWPELESTARQGIALRWRPAHGKRKIDPIEMLGDALFEGGKALLSAGDAANAEIKFAEFTGSFKKDRRYEEAFFLRGKAESGARHFIEALTTFKDFIGRFPRSRFNEEATRTGFDLATDMADEESGLYLGKHYMNSHSNSDQARRITDAYAQLALGNGFYGDGVAALESLAAKVKGKSARAEALARILDIQVLVATPSSILETADRLIRLGNLPPEIMLRVFRAQARAASASNKKGMISRAKSEGAKLWARLGDSDQQNRDAWGEILFIEAEVNGNKEVAEVFSLEIRDPIAHLVRTGTEYDQIKAGYDGVCTIGRNLYCAAALFRIARVAERFQTGIVDLGIADTLEAEVVEQFKTRKAELISRWQKDAAAADNQASELAGQGMAPTGYATAIQLGGADLILDDRTVAGFHGFTQIDVR